MVRMTKSTIFIVAFIVLNVMWSNGVAQTPSPESECTNSLLSLINCEPFLAGDNVTTPPESCCAGLSDLVKTAPTCLCGVITGNPSFSSINLTRALELPSQCGIPVDRSQCAALGAPPPNPPSRPSTPGYLEPPSGSSGYRLLVPSLRMCSLSAFLVGGVALSTYYSV